MHVQRMHTVCTLKSVDRLPNVHIFLGGSHYLVSDLIVLSLVIIETDVVKGGLPR